MQFFKQLTDPALKRLYKFVLKRLIGRFLAEDEIDLDQLDVHLRSGRLELCDLLLNADVLNAELCEANGLPFRVKKGYLGSVRVTISYTNIMSESCLVEIDDIEIVLVPVGEEEAEETKASGMPGKPGAAATAKDAGDAQQQSAAKPRASSREQIDEVSQEGLDFVASWIEQVTSKIKVTLSNICLRLETGDTIHGKNVALLCKLEWAQFTDESASEVASVYGGGSAGPGGFGSTSQSMYQSMAASSLFGISQKAVKFRGISMDLLLPSDEHDEDDSGSVLHHFLASDSSRQCYVQVKLSHYEALEAPSIDADLFLHSIRVVLQPQHFPHFGTLIDAFSDEPPPVPTKDRYTASTSMYASICDTRPAWLNDDDQDNTADAGAQLSLREFERIEQILQQYHKTHEELKSAQRERSREGGSSYDHADFAYPVPRKLSIAESVESVGLSDLEDDEAFFECDPGAESLANSRYGGASSMMAQSMYASALYDAADTESTDAGGNPSAILRASVRRGSRSVRNRVKLHLLECDIIILYDDLLDHETDDEHDGEDHSSESRREKQLRRRRRGLPSITDQERLEVSVKDVILSTLVYQSHVAVSVSVGTFEIVERMLARMSTDLADDEDSLLKTTILRFADVSPATLRKVHLSANLSAQVRVDLKPDGAVESLAVQVSAQPILLEWDMHLIDRAHRLMKLMEESSAAKQKKKATAKPSTAVVADYPMKLDVNTECVEITLRFPMVSSDLIRFGPSATRGLSEDKLVILLEGVKASSYENTPETASMPRSKQPLPWLAEFDVNFDSVYVSLVGPLCGDQRSTTMEKAMLISGRSDITSGDNCGLRIRMQVPSNDEIRAALTAKQHLSQDSLENYIEAIGSANSDSEEKSGDDNDGGRVGSNGWSQDARSRANAFEVAACAAALVDLDILIPHSTVVFNKRSFDRLMLLFDALLMINPIDVNGHNQMMATSAYRNRLVPSYMSMNITLKDGTIQLQYVPPASTAQPKPPTAFIYHFAFQDVRIFQVSQWMGQLVSRLHVAAQNITLLEEDCATKVTSPVLYKNPIGVNEAPILFVGVDIIDQTQEMREMKVELHISQVNLRYDVSSLWMVYLSELLLLEYPPPIIPLDSASTSEEEYLELLQQIQSETYDAVKLAIAPKTVFTKLFVSLYDAILDYSPTTLTSRVMLVLGNVSVSSNVVTGALIQGYKISVRDVQLYLTPERPSYEEVDESILGNELFLTTNKGKKRAVVSFAGESRSRGQLSGLYPSMLVFFEKHGFLLMVTMDFVDLFLRAIVPPVEPRSPLLTGEPELKVTPASLGAPELSIELNMGTANIYACFDSFNTLIELVSTWSEQLSVEGEPRDTTGYVGLDRVKDVSSVSVVTNLGPATVRSSRPAIDDSLSRTPPLAGGMVDRVSSRSSMRTTHASSISNDRDSFSTSLREDMARGSRSGLNLFSQLDENAFGGGQRVFSGTQATTDTEARLLRTRLHEIQKEKNRMVGGTSSVGDYDDMLSATELRRKYKQDEVPSKPKIRINELVIDDYYGGNRSNSMSGADQPADAGAFLMAAESEPANQGSASADNPWFASPPAASTEPAFQVGHPVGSLPEEHTARWLAPGSFGGSPRASSTTSSPRFDPVDEDALGRELSGLDMSSLNAPGDDYDENEEDDDYPMGAFPAGPKRWWGMQAPHDVELSELQTEETESSAFSHQLPFFDDDSTHNDPAENPNPMSMSMMCTGEDEGTEVELDFTLDREMQSTFNRLMDSDDGHGDDGEDNVDEDEYSSDGDNSTVGESRNLYQSKSSPRMGSFHQDMSAPLMIPPRSQSFSDQSSQSGAPPVQPAIISPPDEPTARWFYDDAGGDTYQREGPPSRIYPHHVEIPIGGAAASLSFGEKECDEAIRSVARENAAMKLPASAPVVIRHVLLRDFNICMRFFGGSDWSRDLVNVPTLSRRGSQGPPPDTVVVEGAAPVSKDKKEKLLDALLDNYVPSPGSDLFGGAEGSESSLFGDKPKATPTRSFTTERSSAPKSGAGGTTRKRSLKSGRKTEEMLELVITRIQMRLDMFNDDEAQPLASNTVIALGDIEILDYISTSQIRKIICYWKSDISHPRESSSSMVHVHLMTVRPGRNLCEEHRLKVRILPLRVNLDQEVVSFLRQFVPTDAATRSQSMNLAPGAIPEDDEDDDAGGFDGTELSAMNVSTPSRVMETDVSLGSWFFQSIEIRPCKIKIDYRPNRVDFQALRAGDYLEVINLFVLEGMELVLRRVKASGIDGWAALGEHVLMSWVNDISRHQIHKCVASVSMPPLRSFANIGSGAADLILLPLEHYGRDRRVVRGLKKGAKSFLKSVTIETLNTASKMAQGTQALLEHADDVVSSAASRKKQIKYRQPGSRIARNSKRMGGGGIRSAQDRGGIGSRQYLAQQPSNATEGLYQAYDSLSRELHHAAKTIVAVPLVEYKKTGSQGYVRSVIRAVPVAVLRPMIGATEAMSKALIGVRNAVDPEMKEDVENKFKDFRTI